MILIKNEEKTFDELTLQLCMHERNFTMNVEGKKFTKEALVANANKQSTNNKFICNYCKQKVIG